MSAAAVADVFVPPCHSLHRLLLDRIPRGGYSPPTSHAAAGASASSVDSKKKRKKKKASKLRQAESSSSSSPPPTSSSSQKQQADADINSSNATDSNDPKKPPQFHSSNNNSAKSAHHNDDSSSSSSSSSSQQQQQQQQLPPAVQSILSQSCHYDVLGITNKAASQIEIQKAYRRRCVLTHPDKLPGGIRTAFDKVSEAYEVLSCEKKRAVYDRYGKEGLEKGIASASGGGSSGMDFRFGTTGSAFFGNDLFREFFGNQQQSTSSTTSAFRWAQPPPKPRNRDLRYQLEVSLEELYNGTTKHVAIQQPNPVRPYFPYRKELEVCLPRGIGNGQSVRLSGVVDSVSDSPPADVIFLIRERRHSIYTRRGHDLAMEIKLSLSEAIVGYKRTITCLDGRSIVIGSPYVRQVVQKREVVDIPSLPVEEMYEDGTVDADASTNDTDDTNEQLSPEKGTKTTILSYDLPPSILQTGDVHVLKGFGMPIRGSHHHEQYGDLYIQYVVEMPFGSSSSTSSATKVNAANLTPAERVELARLLSKLEGRNDDPTVGIVHSSSRVDGDATTTTTTVDDDVESGGMNDTVHYLSMASASDFGQSTTTYDDHTDHDEHLRHDDEEDGGGHHGMHHHHHHHQDVSDFFRRAFTGAGRSSSPFGGTGGFHYFSSGTDGSRGYGYNNHGGAGGEEEDHKVECNQM